MEIVYEQLSTIMKKHSSELEITKDKPDNLYVNTGKKELKKDIFFGMVKRSKDKVAFHLMPIYCNPDLISSISPELKKKMQGKSCFNFNKVDEKLFNELDLLTEAGLLDYKKDNKV